MGIRPEDAGRPPPVCLDCPAMKKLLILLVLGGLAAFAAKKIRSV
jgi:hypothetical protein